MGKIELRTKFGDIEESTEFLVIDVDTSYNALLGRPWMHNHHAVPSTYHQCIKYPLPSPKKEGTIVADNDPFGEVEAYYTDARFYTKTSQRKGKDVKKSEDTPNVEDVLESTPVSTKRTFRYVPKSERKLGAKALAPINPILDLKGEFTLPLRRTECTYVEKYNKIVVPSKGKGSKPIIFHSLGDVEQKVKVEQVPEENISSFEKPNFSAKITQMLVKVGLDPEKIPEIMTPFDFALTPSQRQAIQQGGIITARTEGLGYRGDEEKFPVNMTITQDVSEDVDQDEAQPALIEFEAGGQATMDDLREVNLGDEGENKPTFISVNLKEEEARQYISFLREYRDIFAWNYNEMPGLNPEIAVHKLAIHPEKRPINKKNGQIKVCIDFCDLNEACPKDDFSLPITELLVDATTGYETLSFMDGYSGYNQIRMVPEDEEMTALRTLRGVFCYKVMPFGLKNAGATYQRAMTIIFSDMLHDTIECYVDDLVVKTKEKENHVEDLRRIFERLRRYKLKMNPLKCAFGVSLGKFLGFVV
ncbi:uncharacterized protein LOC114299540 [Camellia sinensis]|uniref:uncharacterized protein LOC114299540 n=1 Tax=Camellia sinensis TaxID=4442 RepID=UPI0010365E55|nr:uncharacterized protein LOC114299540 [Camellia sinensis]